MPRLIVLVLLVSTAVAISQPPAIAPTVSRLNRRMQRLYNARNFSKLAKGLYTEDAIVEMKKYDIQVKGPRQIEALFSHTPVGKIDNITLVSSDYRPTDNSFEAVALMFFQMPNGGQEIYRLDEIIVNGRFSHVIHVHIG